MLRFAAVNRSVTHRAPQALADLADRCVQCGLCLPHCPTYRLDQKETESPRGRIRLIRAIDLGSLAAHDTSARASLDHCLACQACETVCPAHVPYAELLLGSRAQTRQATPPPWRQRLLEALAARPRSLRLLARIAARLRWLPLPRRWQAAQARLAQAPPKAGVHAPSDASKGRLWLFPGCFAWQLDATTHRALIRVANRLGWSVQVPPGPMCCGSLHAHAGDAARTSDLHAALRASIPADVSAVLVGASGCTASVRAALAPLPVYEITEWLRAQPDLAELFAGAAQEQALALHVPCTQRHALGSPTASSDVLRACGASQVQTLPSGCCGAAGSQAVLDPERAAQLRAPLLDALRSSGAGTVLSSNYGCALHLQQGAEANGQALRCMHPVEWIAERLP